MHREEVLGGLLQGSGHRVALPSGVVTAPAPLGAQGTEPVRGMGKRRDEDAPGLRTTGRCLVDQPSLRNPGMSQFWKVFSPLRCTSVGDSGGHSSSQASSAPQPPPAPQAPPHPPGSRSGTRCSTCCGSWFSGSPRCSPTRCRPAPQGWSQELQAGPGRSGCAGAHPKLGPGGDRPQPLPSLGTNCDVTPTSKVAKTGEWSLVTMSSVQPGWWEGQLGVLGGTGYPWLLCPRGLTHHRSYRPHGSPDVTSRGCGRTTRGH